MVLGALLEEVRQRFGGYELVDHWRQGEFHHDIVVRTSTPPGAEGVRGQSGDLPGCFLVVATNCNGGVKEVLCFDEKPDRGALWHWRCPQLQDFSGNLPPLLDRAETTHWFDPCELLTDTARSELKAEHRTRQHGGGWEMSAGTCGTRRDG